MALPGNIIYGMIAFAPLGPEFAGQGVLAGLYASVFAGFTATVLGGSTCMITGPRAPTVLIFASILTQVTATAASLGLPLPLHTVLSMGLLSVFLSGLFQIVFVLAKVENLIKYISFPVISGILNGSALLLLGKAFWSGTGLEPQPLSQLISSLGHVQPVSIIIALVTAFLWYGMDRSFPRISGAAAALIGGSLLYYGLKTAGLSGMIGGTFDHFNIVSPSFIINTEFFTILSDRSFRPFLPFIAVGSLTIAILSSIESFLAVLTMQTLTKESASGSRELIGQGAGNIINALFGAIPAGGAASRVKVNYRAGGRTKLSGIIFSLTSLVIIVFFLRYIKYLPMPVISGMTLMVAYLVLDSWSIVFLRRLFRKDIKNRVPIFINLCIVLCVTLMVICFNLMAAVIAGIVLSVVIFVEQMSKSVIRSISFGSAVRSKTRRSVADMDILDRHGRKICIIELEGVFFFGAADTLIKTVDSVLKQGAVYIILDFKRVNAIDISGEKRLRLIYQQVFKKGGKLFFSYIYPGSRLWDFLEDLEFNKTVDPVYFFHETDLAIDTCENMILKSRRTDLEVHSEFDISDFFNLSDETGLSPSVIEPYFEKVQFKNGEVIFRQGDEGSSAYIVTKGVAAVYINISNSGRMKRLTTLSRQTIFGEMALLTGSRRSAMVMAVNDLTCYRISQDNFRKLKKEHPQLALKILSTMAQIMAVHLNICTRSIEELEN